MKTYLLFLLTLSCLLSCRNPAAEPSTCGLTPDGSQVARQLNILFIGTSHTYVNDLPNLVQAVATSMGDSVYTQMSAPGGYDFERHLTLADTRAALQSHSWDYIILQESGWRTALSAPQAQTRVYPFADSLLNLIRIHNANAQLILYLTNGYLGGVQAFGDTDWCQADVQVCTFEGMQDRIKATYLQLADRLKADIAPCGILWKILKRKQPSLALHEADGIHASLLGSYVNALTLYSLIRRKPLKGVFIPPALEKQQALLIQDTVSEVLFECRPDWKDF